MFSHVFVQRGICLGGLHQEGLGRRPWVCIHGGGLVRTPRTRKAGATHPTEMHSCLVMWLKINYSAMAYDILDYYFLILLLVTFLQFVANEWHGDIVIHKKHQILLFHQYGFLFPMAIV